jgi:PAS domain S-box-containing protein
LKTIPVPANEKERIKALRKYGILDTPGEYDFDRITELASILCDTPVSLVSLVDENRQWFKSSVGLDVKETSRDLAFCGYTILNDAIFEVEDATKDERFSDNDLVTHDPKIRFYAGFPLIDPKGYALGSLCVIDRKPKVLSKKQRRALQLLATEVTSLIVERRLKEELRNFEKLFNFSNDLVFIGGIDGYFKKINPAFTKILGWSQEHLLKTSSFEFYHPDDIKNTAKEIRKLADGGATVNFLQRFKTSTGEYKTIEWTSTPEQDTGNIFGIGRDVSELILKEQQLVENEEKLRVFFENSQGLMCTHDLDGKFLTVNAAGASLLGYSVDEIKKLSLFDIVPETRQELVKTYLAEIKNNGRASGQMVTRHKNGSIRIWIYSNILQNETENEPYVIGNGVDITQRHYLEQELKRTGQMLEQTNQVARVGGWEYDVKRKKIFWTSVTKEIHGVPPDYEPGLDTAINFFKEGESRDKIIDVFNEALTRGMPYDEELQLIKANGDEIWVRALGNAEFENDVCIRLYGTMQDIDVYKYGEFALKRSIETQERLNEALIEHIELIEKQDKTIEKIQEFKFLADSIPQVVWTSNPDGSLDYINKHWFDYTGMTYEETVDLGWATVLHPDDIELDQTAWKESIRTGKPYKVEIRFKRAADGVYRWHIGRAIAMKDDRGRIIKWFGSCTDIDEYKRALDLENKVSQFEDFNRIVAHNLRGPAGSIQMLLDMLSEADTDSEKDDLVDMLKQSSSTLIATLNDLMKVLEVRNNKDLPYDSCDLEKIVKGIKDMLKGQMMAKNAIISTAFEVATMEFPKMYLESIFYNMISNALKYGKPDVPPEILITSKLNRGQVVLTFKDNGLGIDLVKHGKDMFKLNKVFHSGFDSKGIGLFMTKTQIETFGGHISVESEPNVGTTFTIDFR